MHLNRVDLPLPDGPKNHNNLSFLYVKIDILENHIVAKAFPNIATLYKDLFFTHWITPTPKFEYLLSLYLTIDPFGNAALAPIAVLTK